MIRSSRPETRGAFTLIELLVSMTVLVIIVALIGQMVTSATSITLGNRERLDADAQARAVFDRMAFDFGKMLKRPDVDYIFAKIDGSNGGENDKMFFYSEAPAFFDGDASKPSTRSSVALAGYRINNSFQLERLGKLLTWDGASSSSTVPGGIVFLTPLGGSPAIWGPDSNSTLAGNWPRVINSAPNYEPQGGSENTDYHVLADQVCRLEICFQLSNGTYSTLPLAPAAGTGTTTLTNNLTATTPPKSTDGPPSYAVGSRWYDATTGRAYVCASTVPVSGATAGTAVWTPLGMQDVRGIVVALAILDGTSARLVPTMSITTPDGQARTVPKLTDLVTTLADATTKDMTSPGSASSLTTVPNFTLTPTARLMAEAWNNQLKQPDFAQKSGLPARAAAQVRVYQRTFILNNQ